MSQDLVLVMNGTWRQNNASFYDDCLPTTFENARFDLFGIFKCQLAT